MWLIITIWACIASAFLMPPTFTMILFFCLAAARVLFLTHGSLIDAVAETGAETVQIARDIRRNGLTVLKTVLGWITAIAVWFAIVVYFHISF
jgi:hypothetical protein